jgi:F-type H+-transporting ATPase subunit gamma
MATLKQIRIRIRTAKNIQQITRAMKLVAAARLKRSTDRVLQARPYSEKLREFMSSLANAGELPSHPLMSKRPVERYALVLITAERGLCGSYNTALLRKAVEFMKETPGEARLITIGKKGTQFMTKRGYDVVSSLTVPGSGATLSDATTVTREAREMFETDEVDAIYVCYSKFYSPIRQVPQVVQLLPIEAPADAPASSSAGVMKFEPDAAGLLHTLLPRYFLTLVWQALLESTASEHGARMSAMTSATDNAGKMIQDLTLKANRERQSAITKEILEVVSGAEAQKG